MFIVLYVILTALLHFSAPETTTRVQISTTSISPYTHSNTEHTNTGTHTDICTHMCVDENIVNVKLLCLLNFNQNINS